MSRLVTALGLIVFFMAGPASAQLMVVQSWAIDTFPGGVAYDSDRDHIWIVNDSSNEVREYTRTGTFVSSFPGAGVGLVLPIGMDFHPGTQNLWICDETTVEKVVEVTRDGTLVSQFSVDLDVQDASGLAYDTTTDRIYIADDNASEVVIFTSSGSYVARWSAVPSGDADSICLLTTEGTLLVGDDNGAMVHKFSIAGGLIASYDMNALLGIQGVEGLSFDAATGNVFLGDSTTGATIIYEISGFVEGGVSVEPATWGAIKADYR
jgi:uncharacterized protein YjiK